MSRKAEDSMGAAERFIAAARGLRQAVGADIPLQQIMILVYLWRHGQSNQIELARALDLKVAAASRHCKSLSSFYVQKGNTAEERGQRLILAKRNPVITREMVYRLAENTHEVIFSFLSDLAGV